MREDGDTLLSCLNDVLMEQLENSGAKEQAANLSSNVVAAVALHFGGQQVYFPLRSKYIEQLIKRDFTGDNIKELIRKYRVSRAQIYKILGKKEPKKNTPKKNARTAPERAPALTIC